MKQKRRSYDKKFKAKVALEAIRGDRTISEIASDYGIHPNQVAKWKKRAIENMESVFANGTIDRGSEKEREELLRKIGEQQMEMEWLKKKLH